MKKILLTILAGLTLIHAKAQSHKTENLVIVTLDGFRWEELYRGADSALINSSSFSVNSSLSFKALP